MGAGNKKNNAVKGLTVLLCLLIAGSLLFQLQAAQAAFTTHTKEGSDNPVGTYRGESTAVKFDISPPLWSIKPVEVKSGGRTEIPELPTGLEGAFGPQDVDLLVQAAVGSGEMPVPSVSFNGPSNIYNLSPPDPVGDVGPNHYVAMSNLSFQIFDKAGNLLLGPLANNTLWSGFGGACQTENAGDPIVLYDQLADRWMLSQFTAAGPTYFNCVAVSTSGDPTGTYYRYAFSTGSNFPDYPKYGIWSDALYISTREFAGPTFAGMGAYAVNRAQLIAGNPAPQVISFLVTTASAGGTYNIGDGLLPSDIDGSTPPPPGTPNFFVGSMDDGGPYGASQDALTLWKFTANFSNPPASTFILANTIPIAAYDTIYPCSPGARDCIPQPGTSNKVDVLSYRQRPMWRLAYRNFGTHESLVTNQAVEAAPSVAGIRWWEIRSPNSNPFIYQEGTYAPGVSDGIQRWMGSVAMDKEGNMALGYSASDATSTFPSVWYTGRLASDPLGSMPQGEASIVTGTGSQTGSQRWGDYTSMNIDPADDCTFWYVNQWVPITSPVGWQLRIGAFRFPECSPDFDLTTTPTYQAICKPTDASYNISVGSLLGFSDPVTLSAAGQPAGTTTSFSTNPVIPPGNSLFTIGNTGVVAAGSYTMTITGTAPTSTLSTDVSLDVFDAPPGKATLVAPANFADNQPLQPAFSWLSPSHGNSYDLEVATDSQFSTIVYSAVGLTTADHVPSLPLSYNTIYYWRVRPSNACGTGETSDPFVFITQNIADVCPLGTLPAVQFSDDFESGALDWTHSGTGDTWALSTANPHSGSTAFHANDSATMSDQRLVSTVVPLPSGENPLTLSFWNYQHMETRTGGCYDGGIVEVSTDGGATWSQVPGSDMLTDPYDGTISGNFSNPLGGLNAWCGNNPQPYLNSLVDVSAYAGQLVRFRFRLGTDTLVSRPGWDIDDVTVQSCKESYLTLLGTNQSKNTVPDSGMDYVFNLLNLGASDTFDLTLSGNAWPTTIMGSSFIAVGAGSAVTVTVHVDTPPVVPDNLDVSDTFTLLAMSFGDPGQNLQTSGTTRSLVTSGAQLSPSAQSQNGTPGSVIDHTFTLTNTGSYTDTFALSVAGNDWPTTMPASIALGAGQGTSIVVQVSIPPQAALVDAVIVSDSFDLTATSGLDSNLMLIASGTTSATVNPALILMADPNSQTGTPGQIVVYNLLVTNNGDFPDSYDLSATGSWGAALSAANSGTLSPGESSSLQLSVTIPSNAAIGDSDLTTVMAASTLDAAIQTSIQVTTSVDYRHLYLPLVER